VRAQHLPANLKQRRAQPVSVSLSRLVQLHIPQVRTVGLFPLFDQLRLKHFDLVA
jgi:hypothetical protein